MSDDSDDDIENLKGFVEIPWVLIIWGTRDRCGNEISTNLSCEEQFSRNQTTISIS